MATEPEWETLTNELDELSVDLWYPRQRKAKAVRVSLMDVRAADDLVIRFDHDRNGWVIYMDLTEYTGPGNIEVLAEEQEVAFVPAWNQASSPSVAVDSLTWKPSVGSIGPGTFDIGGEGVIRPPDSAD